MHAPPGLESALVSRLHTQANAARWSVSQERFALALSGSLAHARAGADTATSIDADRYLAGLHLEDLALAVACIDGHEAAWEHFIAEHKSVLSRAAMAIDPAGGSELADSLYADLFGLQQKGGERQSLFRYFHGRSRLATWLRAILAQRHIDRVRATKRLEPLPEEDRSTTPALVANDRSAVPEGDRLRFLNAMRDALASAIGELAAKDRLRLSSYYARDMTLAAIGRMLGEHEATVSRHLTRTRREIRTAAEARLRNHHGLDDRAIGECFASVTEDAGALDLGELFGKTADRKNDRQNRSKT